MQPALLLRTTTVKSQVVPKSQLWSLLSTFSGLFGANAIVHGRPPAVNLLASGVYGFHPPFESARGTFERRSEKVNHGAVGSCRPIAVLVEVRVQNGCGVEQPLTVEFELLRRMKLQRTNDDFTSTFEEKEVGRNDDLNAAALQSRVTSLPGRGNNLCAADGLGHGKKRLNGPSGRKEGIRSRFLNLCRS